MSRRKKKIAAVALLLTALMGGVALAQVSLPLDGVVAILNPAPPPASPVLAASRTQGCWAYVQAHDGLFPVELSTMQADKHIALGWPPKPFANGLVVTPDGSKAFAAQSQSIIVYDLFNRSVIKQIPSDVNAWDIAINPAGTTAYASIAQGYEEGGRPVGDLIGSTNNSKRPYILPIATGSATPLPRIPTDLAGQLAISPDGTKALVLGYVTDAVQVVDLVNGTLGAPITVGFNPVAVDFANNSTAYVMVRKSIENTGANYSSNQSTLIAIDIANSTAGQRIELGKAPSGGDLYGKDFVIRGNTAYVATVDTKPGANFHVQTTEYFDPEGYLQIVDLAAGNLSTRIPAGRMAVAVQLTPDGSTAYVVGNIGAPSGSGNKPSTITKVNLGTRTAGLPLRLGPEGTALAGNALDLFFSSSAVCSAAPPSGDLVNSVTPEFPSGSFSVNQQFVPASVDLKVESGGTESSAVMRWSDIYLTVGCSAIESDSAEFKTDPCATPDAGTFKVNPSATGSVGTVCAGLGFSISSASNNQWHVVPAAPLDMKNGETCRIDFTVDVLKMPQDIDPAYPDAQTYATGRGAVTVISGGTIGLNAKAAGIDEFTVYPALPPRECSQVAKNDALPVNCV